MELESPFLHVPIETLSRNLKGLKKQLDKELDGIIQSVDTILNSASTDNDDLQLNTCLGNIQQHLQQLSSWIGHYKSQDEKALHLLSTRLNFARQLENPNLEGETIERLNNLRLYRLLVVHLLREGYTETAEKLVESTNIGELVDLEVFKTTKSVVDALSRGDCSEALKWCAENRKKLQKMKSSLEFDLHVQVFVELRRQGKVFEAISYARKNLSTCPREQLKQVQRVLTLLAFPESTSCEPYRQLYSRDRWKELIQAFRTEYYILNGLTKDSLLEIVMKAGLSALKTSCCFDEDQRNVNCPVCHEPYRSLSTELPFSHHVHSVLVCRMSGEIMDEHNPPMILPNGNAYSEKALKEMAERNGGKIYDPQSGEVFDFPSDDIRKAFIM
ncbi:Macrophage erythroblast attacher [Galdieria sulphuraria]|nr:Macrophage erythroblast attacher [Galdieria sulphuraria]